MASTKAGFRDPNGYMSSFLPRGTGLFALGAGGQERFHVKGVLIVRISGVLEIGVLGDVILIRQKQADAPRLEDTFSSVHNRKLILAHQFFATLSSEEFILFAFIHEIL